MSAIGERDRLRYTLPEPVQRAGWLEQVLVGPAGASYTTPAAVGVRWSRVDPLNVEGDLYLTLSRAISPTQQLLFRCRPPYAYDHQASYTSPASVLTPAGTLPASTVRPPTRLFVLGTTWRCLQQKLSNLTGQARPCGRRTWSATPASTRKPARSGRSRRSAGRWATPRTGGPWGGAWRTP